MRSRRYLLFSDRLLIAKEVDEWYKKYPQVSKCPLNVITFLQISGYLDTKEILRHINNGEGAIEWKLD